ncbi:hypothetical protein HPB47_017308, partial [Ixodes persulcatus]
RYHYEIYRKVVADSSMAPTGAEASSAIRPRSSGQQKLTAMLPAGTARVSISDQIIVSACVELCSVNGRPFALMEDSGFRQILDPLLDGLSTKTVINAENIRTRVALLADEMREEIRQQVKGRLISLKVDCVTRMDRSMLGVNLQFVSDGKIVLRTFAIKELKEGHTASYLQSILLEVLAAYNVELCQLYSITTDNGTNLVKSVKSLMEDQQQQSGSDDEGEVTGDQNAELQLTSDDPFDDTGPWPGVLRGVRCAAHTLQLAVDDAMKKASAKATVAKAREVCKKLRCPNNDAFRAAVFLDPRYNILLSEGDKQHARAHLSNTWANIVRFSRDANDCRESPTSSLGSDDELDALLKEKEKSQVAENYEKRRALKSIAAALSDFEREKRLKKDENVLAYWETQRLERPELHELAKVVLACPATQAHTCQALPVKPKVASAGLVLYVCLEAASTDSVIEYVIVYEKGYQQFSTFSSASTTKVKGVLSTEALPDDAFYEFIADKSIYKKVWDFADIVYPPVQRANWKRAGLHCKDRGQPHAGPKTSAGRICPAGRGLETPDL